MSRKLHFISASLVTLCGTVAAFGWTDVVSAHTAAVIVTGLGAAKMALTVLDKIAGGEESATK